MNVHLERPIRMASEHISPLERHLSLTRQSESPICPCLGPRTTYLFSIVPEDWKQRLRFRAAKRREHDLALAFVDLA